MRILTVVGARPQFIKAAAVSRALQKRSGLSEIILHTGQHYDANMSEVFFDEMNIPKPQYRLSVDSGLHGAMTGKMLTGIEEVLLSEKPDAVLVYGDTNSTLAGALAATKLHIRVAHVEAGLRSFNRKMPEEINRILTDQVSKWLFCPTTHSQNQLLKEGFSSADVHVVGDVMYDAALFYLEKAKPTDATRRLIENNEKFVLCTIHRAENTDDESRLKGILSALAKISEERTVVLPLHPRTKKKLSDLSADVSRLNIIDPVGYFDMLHLLKTCSLVMTDSGGLQKEAYFFNKPCLTMRDETEWVETIEVGANRLVGAQTDIILNGYFDSLKEKKVFPAGIYGDGTASCRILDILSK